MRSMMHAAHTTPDQRPVLTGYAIQAGERSKRQECGRGSRRWHAILHIKIGLPQRLRAAAMTPPMNADPRQSPDTI
jgi:hypothetical protein